LSFNPAVNEIDKRVLRSFELWKREKLDLHTLFEAGENDPDARTAVFDSVERLVKEGLLQEEGNDFYSLTERGKRIVMSDE
jgi:DNA-binding transcriptional regulator PaaX